MRSERSQKLLSILDQPIAKPPFLNGGTGEALAHHGADRDLEPDD
jgi:hypothetical protein